MSDDNPIPPAGGAPPPPPPPPPSYGAPPPQAPGYGAPPPQTPGYGTPPAYPPQPYGAAVPALPYAQWPQRALAWLIDNGPLLVLSLILSALGNGGRLLGDLLAIGWFVYNYGYMQGTTGYTLGKGIVGIKTVSEETGQPVGFGMAVVRGITHILDSLACLVGWLWPLWDSKRQTFADKILSQVVITAPKG